LTDFYSRFAVGALSGPMGSAASPFIVEIVGLAQPLTEAHGNNDDRDSMQRRFPHDGFLSSR
jgi:hypothetical protein